MRVAAGLGFLIFGAMVLLFLKLTKDSYEDEKNGELLAAPAFSGVVCCIGLFCLAMYCLLYAIGLWEPFIGLFSHVDPEQFGD